MTKKNGKKGGSVGGKASAATKSPTASKSTPIPSTLHPKQPKLYCRVFPLLTPTRSDRPGVDNVVPVNYDGSPITIHNEHFTGHAVFRVNSFDGIMPLDPSTGLPLPSIFTSEYFKGHRRTFSLQFAGRFRKEWSADDVMFGTFFESPVILPTGYTVALKFAKKIDASMDGDLNLPQPYMCSPVICAMNVARADPIIPTSVKDVPSQPSEDGGGCVFNNDAETTEKNKPLYLPRWEHGGAGHLQENFMLTVPSWPESNIHHHPGVATEDGEEDSDPLKEEENNGAADREAGKSKRSGSLMSFFSRTLSTSEEVKSRTLAVTPSQRREWFLNPEHRRAYKFRPDTLYSFDFNNQYVDLNKMQLKLIISFDVSYYLNGQPVRYQMRSRDGSVTFFTIELGLA